MAAFSHLWFAARRVAGLPIRTAIPYTRTVWRNVLDDFLKKIAERH